jgi:hypothetical protein
MPLNQLDPFMLRLGLTRDALPDNLRFEGGAHAVRRPTSSPPSAVVRDVHVVDYKSLYPSIIIRGT